MALGKRAELLASEFRRFGMPKPAAVTLSSEAVLRHPLAHRVGVPKLARRLAGHGVAPEDATQLALTLYCLERLMLGACFQDLLDVLRRAGVDEDRAFPASVEARRLWRESDGLLEPVAVDRELARWCVLALALMLAAQLLTDLAV